MAKADKKTRGSAGQADRDHDAVGAAIDLLGERWTLLILREAFFGNRRFGTMQRRLGIARNVLNDRLRRLVAEGILKRQLYRRDPDWYEYVLTRKGRDLFPAIMALMRWSHTHLARPEDPRLALRHTSCGKHMTPRLVCSECGEEVVATDVEPALADVSSDGAAGADAARSHDS